MSQLFASYTAFWKMILTEIPTQIHLNQMDSIVLGEYTIETNMALEACPATRIVHL